MNKFNILIAGCGDVGTAAAMLLAQDHNLYGLKRSTNALPNPIKTIIADLNDPSSLIDLPNIDIIIYCAAPNLPAKSRSALSTTEKLTLYRNTYLKGFENLVASLNSTPKHIFFTSSTSVYHQYNHEIIDEQSPALAQTETGKIMLAAEQQALSLDIPATVIRFSGIYSDSRISMFNKVADAKVFADTPVQYSNRIHVDDCAGVLNHLIKRLSEQQPLEAIYLASDQLPEPISVVSHWLAKQINIIPNGTLKGRMAGSKRCDNTLLLKSGYQFIYPSYKEGYKRTIEHFNINKPKE